MAQNGSDATYGYPKFPVTDAPEIGVDEEIVAAYARWRGNRIVDTEAVRTAFTDDGYAYKGLTWFESDNDQLLEYTGSAWERAGRPDRGIINGSTPAYIPNDTSTTILFETQDFVRGVSAYLNPSLYGFTVVNAGFYRVSAYALWESNATGRRDLQIRVNNALRYLDRGDASTASPAVPQNIMVNMELAAGDVVTAWGVQTSGGSLGVTTRTLSVEELV